MIEYGSNGKMNGLWILTEILSAGLISFADEDVSVTGDRKIITDLHFDEAVKKDRDLSLHFREVVGEFLHLSNYIEKNRELMIDPTELTDEIRNDGNQNGFSGLSFLRYFMKGQIRIWEEKLHRMEVIADGRLCDYIPGFRELLTEMIHTVLRYSGDDRELTVSVIRKDYFRTERMSDDLQVTFSVNDILEKAIDRSSGAGMESLSRNRAEKEENIDKNVSSTLTRLKEQMDAIGRKGRNGNQDPCFKISYSEEKKYESTLFSVDIPDGFFYDENRDGYPFLMWFPHEDNPEMYETAPVLLTVEMDETGKTPEFLVSINRTVREQGNAQEIRQELLSHTFINLIK